MDKRHPVKACKVRLENPVLPCGHPGKADLLTGLVFISYLGDAYQTQPQTWSGLGTVCQIAFPWARVRQTYLRPEG